LYQRKEHFSPYNKKISEHDGYFLVCHTLFEQLVIYLVQKNALLRFSVLDINRNNGSATSI